MIDRANRLREAVQSAGGKKAIAERADIPLSTLGHYFGPHEGARLAVIERIAEACGVDAAWLAFGGPSAVHLQSRPEGVDRYAPIPRYNVQASAGNGALIDNEQIVDHLAFDRTWLKSRLNRSPKEVLLIEARGDSMEPTIRDGDLLLVDMVTNDIVTSAIHVIELEGELLVKRLERRFDGSVLVHSDNPRYQPQTLTRDDRPQLRIVGHVIWQGGSPR